MIDSSLPLTDIHRRLDGNIGAQTILDLGREFNIALPQPPSTLRPHFRVTGPASRSSWFPHAKLDWGGKVTASLEACRRVAYSDRRRGLRTLSCASPRYMAMTHRLPVDGVVVIAGVQEDAAISGRRPAGGILSRTFTAKPVRKSWRRCSPTARASLPSTSRR